jgi:DNA-directed RNA polymerase subunit RPC12/RpoP
MAGNQKAGTIGEAEAVRHVPCPNCGKKLMPLPKNYPLYDVQCSGCSFRAQVKTNNHAPSSVIRGAGWQIMDKVLKSGFITPPLFANFKWKNNSGKHQEIRFYPFVPKKNLLKYKLSEKARRANYWMFNYIGLNKLPYFVVYPKK